MKILGEVSGDRQIALHVSHFSPEHRLAIEGGKGQTDRTAHTSVCL